MDTTFSHGHPDHDACGTGFILRPAGGASHEVVDRALTALHRLSHRGGVDADAASGDGAGLLTALPQRMLARAARDLSIPLPRAYGLGMLFISGDDEEVRVHAELKSLACSMELQSLGWRKVPTKQDVPGTRAAETAPAVWQWFVAGIGQSANLERQLFLLRKRAESALGDAVYFCSLSSRTVVYKGLLSPRQLAEFYPDLNNPDFETSFAIFHQRFSTNTQPAWRLAQPFRLLAHNGEINTITGNRRWMMAREAEIRTRMEAGEWFHALEENVSDSASLDNAVELLLHQGKPIDHAMLSLVPPAIGTNSRISAHVAAMVETAAHEYEPWDGPAALVFTDGKILGAKLDRNGLRPMRYTRTASGWIVAGSETGLADFDEADIIERQRLGPGEALLVDVATGKVFPKGAFTREIACPKQIALSKPVTRLQSNSENTWVAFGEPRKIAAALGWTDDQIKFFLHSLAQGKEPIFSMGDDTPPAFLSRMRRTLWDYCKQRFAQVTNPAIDPLREQHVMSLEARIGADFVADSPVLDERQLHALEQYYTNPQHIDVTFAASLGVEGAVEAINRIRREARWPGKAPSMVVISDRQINAQRAAVPMLIAVAAMWKEMICGGHFRVPLIVETAQAIETHHIALLMAVGATAVRPLLAQQLAEEHVTGGATNYYSAVNAGLRKVLSRMGISTLASYRNAQLFEVIGLEEKLCEEFFESAPHCGEANSLEQLVGDYLFNHAQAFKPEFKAPADAGLYRFRKEGEKHSTSAELMRKLHAHIKNPSEERYKDYESLAQEREPVAVRDLLEFVTKAQPIADESVEPEAAIMRRFSVQAMSVGAISPEAHRTLALAMNELGARSNTGEGGEDPEIYSSMPEARCRVKQVASGRFGVTAEYLVNADELEIKIAQGSKPGEGGQIPASKVSVYIAKLRHAVPGMALVSPPPHHDIYSIEDLEQLIHDLLQINPAARIGVKLVSGAGVGIIAAGVAKAGADVITISGYDGGTGASPLSSIKNTGLPWEFGLRDAHNTLIQAGLRQNVRLRVDGGFKFARDVVMAALLGADEYGFGTAALLAMGCVMARQCHLNTCPVGIATQDETLRTRFAGRPEMVKNYFKAVATETRALMARLGVRSLEEIIGRTELLQPRIDSGSAWISGLLRQTETVSSSPKRCVKKRELSRQLIEIAKNSGRVPPPVLPIVNADRSIGAELSGERLRQKVNSPLEIHFKGTAGQSFGAFLGANIKFHLKGAANDYVGKGMSGGTIAIEAGSVPSRRGDVLAGNTILYGATSGELYIAGQTGERFAVRNSGATAVVEGVGDHGCEYMTGGVVVILGPTGINLGSGMTGGLTYLLTDYLSENSHNAEFVQMAACSAEEERAVRQLIMRHWILTRSERAALLLASGMSLPITRMQPLALPCSINDTWQPILQRFEHAALSGLYRAQPAKGTQDFPRRKVRPPQQTWPIC